MFFGGHFTLSSSGGSCLGSTGQTSERSVLDFEPWRNSGSSGAPTRERLLLVAGRFARGALAGSVLLEDERDDRSGGIALEHDGRIDAFDGVAIGRHAF